MNTYDLIRHAVLERRSVSFMYKGHPRRMSPHALGVKNGRRQALFYQFGGTSGSGLSPSGSTENWRCIPVDLLSEVTLIDEPWRSAENWSRSQVCVDEIDVSVVD